MKKIHLTKTVKRLAFWNAMVMLGLYFAFIFFTFTITNYVVTDNLDIRLKHEIEHILNSLDIVSDSLIILNTTELNEPSYASLGDEAFLLQIYDLEGKVFVRSKNLEQFSGYLLGFPNNFDPYYFEDLLFNNTDLRIVYKQLFNKDYKHIGYIQLGAVKSGMNYITKKLLLFNLITLPLVIVIIIILSVFLAKKSYERLNNIIDLAKKISATNLNERLTFEADPNDEIGKLRDTLNSLFNRLEKQINQISQFTDNASHQLMTPLTTLKTELDYLSKKKRSVDEYKESIAIFKEQTDRMIKIVKTMLILSRDCKDCSDKKSVFELSNLIKNELINIYKNRNVKFDIIGKIYLRGKAEYFSIVLQNLVDNALKYSDDKEVRVTATADEEFVEIIVADKGIGIPDSEKERIFERFYRGAFTQNNTKEGYGLGLSLVYSIVTSMGGEIVIRNNDPAGTKFIIKLPIVKLS